MEFQCSKYKCLHLQENTEIYAKPAWGAVTLPLKYTENRKQGVEYAHKVYMLGA